MPRTLRAILNEGNPNKVPVANQDLRMGDALNLVARTFRGTTVADILVLPADAKGATLLSAYAAAATVAGEKTPLITGAAPATLQAALNSAGDVLFNAATDEVTVAEVTYHPFEGPVIEENIVVDAGGTEQGTLLGSRAAAIILEVESLAGGLAGTFTVANRGTTPATTLAAIADDPTLIEFAAADAVTLARVKYIAQPGVGSTRIAVGVNLDAEDKNY